MTRSLPLLALCLALTGTGASAAEEPSKSETKAAPEIPEPRRFTSSHSGRFGARQLRYQVTAGESYLRDDAGEPTASFFCFAYVEEGISDPATRPVTFVWNGGPGSSSVWLHMGSFGPRRVVLPSDARDDGAPPWPIQDNPLAPLDLTDLVFVDPVGTGFSRPLGDHQASEFWGLNEDAASVAGLIRTWITDNGRWASPKYLAGESFGTTRAAAVTGLLEGGPENISLNGLILVSQALDYTGSTPEHDNLIAFVTYLPSMAATAWYHGRVADRPADLASFVDEARRFAVEVYAPALIKGSGLPADERVRVVSGLARFSGLSEAYLERADLRVIAWRFLKELRRDEGLALGRLDSRYASDDIDDTAELPEGDAAGDAIGGAYTAALHHYMRAELGVTMERRYRVSGGSELGSKWRWRTVSDDSYWEPSYVNVARTLGQAMRRNPELRVLVANGYYDFATPFYDAEFTFARHGILPERVSMHWYEAGHMMYLHDPSREALLRDVRAFLAATQRAAATP